MLTLIFWCAGSKYTVLTTSAPYRFPIIDYRSCSPGHYTLSFVHTGTLVLLTILFLPWFIPDPSHIFQFLHSSVRSPKNYCTPSQCTLQLGRHFTYRDIMIELNQIQGTTTPAGYRSFVVTYQPWPLGNYTLCCLQNRTPVLWTVLFLPSSTSNPNQIFFWIRS